MKKLFYLLCFLFFIQTVQGQHERYNVVNPDLSKKNKTQRTVGFVLRGIGTVTTIVGFSIATNHLITDIIERRKQVSGTCTMVAGMAMMAGCTPLFVGAGKNRKAILSVPNFSKWQIEQSTIVDALFRPST